MAIKVKNGSKRLIKEIWRLKKENLPLLKLLLDVRNYVKKEFNKDITITMIDRTEEEQDYLYKDNARYKRRKFRSPHQFLHAIDLRSSDFTNIEIGLIEGYLNDKYKNVNYYRFTALYHSVGHGDHLHIQLLENLK